MKKCTKIQSPTISKALKQGSLSFHARCRRVQKVLLLHNMLLGLNHSELIKIPHREHKQHIKQSTHNMNTHTTKVLMQLCTKYNNLQGKQCIQRSQCYNMECDTRCNAPSWNSLGYELKRYKNAWEKIFEIFKFNIYIYHGRTKAETLNL